MLRRVVLLCGALLVGVIVLGGVALAKDIRGTFGRNTLIGTNQMDRIYGLGAADVIRGKAGNDDCYGGSGADEIRCGGGFCRLLDETEHLVPKPLVACLQAANILALSNSNPARP